MAKRESLASFSPVVKTSTEGTVVDATEAPAPTATNKKYHSLHVYLNADEVKTIKQIALDNDQKASDIGAKAIREWLERNGHLRSKIYSA